jgi:hypothetical protein
MDDSLDVHRCWGRTINGRRCGRYGDWYIFCHDHKWQWLKWLKYPFIVLATLASIYGGYKLLFPTSETKGVLIPDNATTPPYDCGAVPPDAMIIFLGNSVAYQINPFPINIFTVAGQSFLSIDKIKDNLYISAKIFSYDSKILAEIRDNIFYINPNNYFRIERPNKHTLVVYDQQSRKVLDIYFINSKSVKILGIFNIPNRIPIVIEEEKQKIEGGTYEKNCFGHAVGTFFDIK